MKKVILFIGLVSTFALAQEVALPDNGSVADKVNWWNVALQPVFGVIAMVVMAYFNKLPEGNLIKKVVTLFIDAFTMNPKHK